MCVQLAFVVLGMDGMAFTAALETNQCIFVVFSVIGLQFVCMYSLLRLVDAWSTMVWIPLIFMKLVLENGEIDRQTKTDVAVFFNLDQQSSSAVFPSWSGVLNYDDVVKVL